MRKREIGRCYCFVIEEGKASGSSCCCPCKLCSLCFAVFDYFIHSLCAYACASCLTIREKRIHSYRSRSDQAMRAKQDACALSKPFSLLVKSAVLCLRRADLAAVSGNAEEQRRRLEDFVHQVLWAQS